MHICPIVQRHEFTVFYDSTYYERRKYTMDKCKKCELCHQEFSKATIKQHHFDEIHRKRIFRCNVCQVTIERHEEVIKHNKDDHEGGATFVAEFLSTVSEQEAEHPCLVCGRKYNDLRSLEYHVQYSHATRQEKEQNLSSQPTNCQATQGSCERAEY